MRLTTQYIQNNFEARLKNIDSYKNKLGLSCAKLSKALASYPVAVAVAGNYDVITFSYLLSKVSRLLSCPAIRLSTY